MGAPLEYLASNLDNTYLTIPGNYTNYNISARKLQKKALKSPSNDYNKANKRGENILFDYVTIIPYFFMRERIIIK
jgi:hypothetical protein